MLYSVFERSVERFAVHGNASKYKVRASVSDSLGTDKAPVWRLRSPHHCCCEFIVRIFEPKPH